MGSRLIDKIPILPAFAPAKICAIFVLFGIFVFERIALAIFSVEIELCTNFALLSPIGFSMIQQGNGSPFGSRNTNN